MVNGGCKICANLMRQVLDTDQLHKDATANLAAARARGEHPNTSSLALTLKETGDAKSAAIEQYQEHLLEHRQGGAAMSA